MAYFNGTPVSGDTKLVVRPGGVNSVVGCLGYFIYDADINNKTLTLSKLPRFNVDGSENERILPDPEILAKWGEPAIFNGREIANQYVSYDVGMFYALKSKITTVNVETGVITLDVVAYKYQSETPLTQEKFNELLRTEQMIIYTPLTPEAGEVVVSQHASAYGVDAQAIGGGSFAINYRTQALGPYGFAANAKNIAGGYGSAVFGQASVALGDYSLVQGSGGSTTPLAQNGHAEGHKTEVSASHAHAEGELTVASGEGAHSEGTSTKASGDFSHAEGNKTEATGKSAHAEGSAAIATGAAAHAEGKSTVAEGGYSHTEGESTKTGPNGRDAHAEGYGTIANSYFQHVQGKWNVEDAEDKYAHIIGGGSSNTKRKNIHTVDWSGNAYFAGSIIIGNTTITEDQLKKLLALI